MPSPRTIQPRLGRAPRGDRPSRQPQQRARLADAILRLRAQHRLTPTQAAYAIYHLNTRSQHLLAASVTHAMAVAVGASRTPAAASESPPNPDHSSSGSSRVSLSLDVERNAGDDDLRKRCEGVA
jgi:hypothetical protein